MKKLKTQKGITLIALIITIVVLLILAVVAIGAAQESNIVGYAQNAAGKYEEGKGDENNSIAGYEDLLSKYANGGQQSSTNKDKGIGTDGQLVNMDYWKYTIINEERKEVGLYIMDGTVKSAAYVGPITAEGKIVGTIPQYIEIDGKEGTYTVTSTDSCFYQIEDLKIPPVIPSTVTSVISMFEHTGLIEVPIIPSNVIDARQMLAQIGNGLTGTLRIESENINDVSHIIFRSQINKIQVPAGSVTETNIRNYYGSDPNITIETF